MFENVPKNWKKDKIENVANVNYGTRVVKELTIGSKYYVYGGGDKTFKTDEYNREKTLIVARFGMSPKCTRFVREKFFLNDSGLTVDTNNINILNQEFLNWQLLFLNDLIYSLGKGVAQKNLNVTLFKKMNIIIPPTLGEQEEIVKVLDTASDMVRLRKQCIQHAQDLIPALFQEMFGAIDDNNYEKVLFGNIITVLTDYHANGSYEKLKEHVTLLDNPDYALMVRTTDLEKNNFRDNVKYINQSAYEFLEKSKIYGGEIIINKIGSAGNVYLMPNLNRPVSLGMNTFLIRIDEKQANNIFIYNLLNSSYGKNIIQEKISGAVTKTITKNSIRGLKLYLPSIEQQELFAQRAIEIENYIKEQQEELKKSEDLFQSLLHHAFTGELTRRAYGN